MTDFDLMQQLAAQRRNQFAQQSQFQAPQGQMVGRHFVAPNVLQQLAAGLRAFGGMRGQQLAEQELQDISRQRTEGTQKALADFLRQAQGTPENAPGDGMGPTLPAMAPDMRGAYSALLQAPDQGLRQAGMQGLTQMPQMEAQAAERAAQREFQRQQMEAQNQQRIEQLQLQHQMRMDQLAAQNASRQDMLQAQQQFQREMAQMRRAMTSAPSANITMVDTAEGSFLLNNRTGQLQPAINPATGQPLVRAGADPRLQGQIAGAETTARRQAESTAEARGEARKADMFLSQLSQAELILKEGPTASGIGTMRDAAGRMIGVNTAAADRAGQLEALSGWLVANVPRMEGPQSNFDVQNYMLMAAKIGDRTTPVSERLAALQEVRRLQEKYRDVARERVQTAPNFGGGGAAPAMPQGFRIVQ